MEEVKEEVKKNEEKDEFWEINEKLAKLVASSELLTTRFAPEIHLIPWWKSRVFFRQISIFGAGALH